MADPELVAYLRKNLAQFGPDALRENLRAEGVAEPEIDAALVEAAKPPRARPKFLPVILGSISAAAVGLFLLMDSPAPSPGPGRPAAGAGGEGKAAETEPRAAYGRYGTVVRVPAGYESVTDYKDASKTIEVVYIAPAGTDYSHFHYERLYGHLKILRLEASPLGFPEKKLGLERVRQGVTRMLQNRKATYEIRDIQAQDLQGFQVTLKEPFPLAQAFLASDKVLYVLTGGTEDDKFAEVLNSLHEAAPRSEGEPGQSPAP